MKQARKLSAVIICFILVLGSIIPAIAEDITTASEENFAQWANPAEPSTASSAELESAATGSDRKSTPEAEEIGPSEESADPTGEPAIDPDSVFPQENDAPQSTEKPSDESDTDFTRSAAHSLNFFRGYAKLISESLAYASPAPGSETLYKLYTGVFYVLNRSNTLQADRLEVAFDGGDGVQTVWIDANCLRPMSPKESESFIHARTADANVRFLHNDAALPLDIPSFAPAFTLALAAEDAPDSTPPAMLVPQVEFTLGVGEKALIPVSFSDDEAHHVIYASENSKIAGVSADGIITPKKVGSTDIYLTSEFGNPARVHVIVQKAPSKVSLSAARSTLGVNEQLQLNVTLPSGAASKISYSTSNPAVASVDSNGFVTTYAAGSTVITVKTFNGKKASGTLTVKPAPQSIRLNETELTLGIGQTAKLTATLSQDSAGAYSFASSDPSVLKVDPSDGTIEAVAAGTAAVTVETYNHQTASCAVTVKPGPSTVSFAESSMIIGVGESLNVPEVILGDVDEDCAGSYTFATSNNKILAVNAATGVIKGVKAGSAKITVTTHNNKSAQLNVTVQKAPSKVSLSAARSTLGVGEQLQLIVSLPSGSASKLTYSSSNPAVATVDDNGLVTSCAAGTTVIAVKTFNGKKASGTLIVKSAPQSIRLSTSELTIGVGQTEKLTPTLSQDSAGAYSFASSDPSVLKVDASSGTMEGLAVGTATVIVETYNHQTASCAVTVRPGPSAVSFTESNMIIGVGESLNVPEVILEGVDEDYIGNYTFATSNNKILAVNAATGVIKGVKAGSAKITVTTYNNKSAQLTVTVGKAPSKVTLSAPHKLLGIGEKIQLTAALPSGTASRLTFLTGDENIAEISETGVVTAVSAGTVKVGVKTFNNKSATLTLAVAAAPAAISLPDTFALGLGETCTVAAVQIPADCGGTPVYSVDDASVLTFNAATGTIKGLNTGTTTLRVRTYNGLEAACLVTVKAAPTSISLQDTNFTLAVGDKYQLQTPIVSGEDSASATIAYKSSNTRYAQVSSTGVITAVKTGTATITATTYNGKNASITVTVKTAPNSIAFSEGTHSLFIDAEYAPSVLFANGIPGSYTLSSSDPNVISVSGRMVRGVAGGTATLTATSFNNKQATMQIIVPFLPDNVSLNPASLVIGEGDSATLKAIMPSGQGAALTFESLNPEIASIVSVDNETVKVSGVSVGTAVIHVRSQNGCESTAQVTVRKAPTAVSVSPNRAARSIQEAQLQLNVRFGSEDEGGSVAYASSDTSVASVSANGLVTFVSVGTANIVATTYNGHTATCELTVGEQPGSMFFDREEYAVALGDSVQLPASFDKGCESYTLFSSDATVAAVSGDIVQGVSLGTATLTAVSRSGYEASCTVRIVDAPTGVALDVAQADLVAGCNSTLQLHAAPFPDGVGTVHYSSSDPNIAAVDYVTGFVTARSAGDCVIYATTYNGHSTECKIHVSYLLEGVKVGIDPGHQRYADTSKESSSPKGGASKYKVSHGTSGCSTHIGEYRTVLTVGLQLREALEKLGATVYMTRETHDVNISNQQRAKLMNGYGVDVVLRLHCNSSNSSSTKGINIYIRKTCAYGSDVVDGSALMANESKAASAVLKHFVEAAGCKNNGVHKNDTYTMNNWSTVPCLLVEMGYMSNSAEDRNLNDPEYQAKMVRGMVNGVCEYMDRPLPTEW